MKNLSLTLSLFLVSLCCLAQNTITGRIISQADTKPVANANVFLSNATIGDHTATNGAFTLAGIKPGKYQLVVSIVGYETYTQDVIVTHVNIDLQTITIYPKPIGLKGVTIKAKAGADADRPRYLAWFTNEFLGSSDLSKECKLLNPELLDFNYDNANNILTATSIDFLVVQNDALGYRVKYLLKDFTLEFGEEQARTFSYSGSVLFEAMKGSPAQQKEWQRRRQEVFEGSQMHFLRSAIAGSLEQDGFRALRLPANPQRPADSVIELGLKISEALKNDKKYRDSLAYWKKKAALPKNIDKLDMTPLKKEDIITGPNKQGIYTLNFNGDAYFITYNKYHHFNRSARSKLSDPENKDNTLVNFSHPRLLFDANGSVINPNGLVYDGVWVRGRLATLLPLDFEPLQNNPGVEIDSALVKNIATKVDAYTTNHVTEKTYLHFDKPYYAAGDTMYFKAYLTQGNSHALSHLSRILYVDLINPNNKISSSLKLLVSDGVAWGDIALPRTAAKGSYRVRAYTQWMRNEGDAAFFDKTITIGSSLAGNPVPNTVVAVKSTGQATPVAEKADTRFFSEGGNIVAGVPNKIAFKAIGANGLGVDVNGVVVDSDNKEITTFTSSHLGMGAFNLIPAEGKTYTAKVTYPNGIHDVIDLPKTSPNAVNMAFTDLGRLYAVKINSSKQWYQQNKGKSYTLIVYSGGMLQSFTVKLDNPQISLDVLKRDFRTGIATATLFTAGGEPLCERLLFVQNNDQLKLDIITDKATYSARAKTGIKFNVTGGAGDPASGHFSVAVVDETKVPADDYNDPGILGNILLTSDLKGYIEQPGYYFAKPNEKTAADLDLVMLTHGYRNFEWQKILTGVPPGPYQPEKGLTLSGIVKFNGKPLKNGKVKLFSRSAGGMILDTLSDANGRFVFDNLTFDDTTKFVLQARTPKDQKEVDVKPDSVLASPVITVKNTPAINLENLSVYEQNSRALLDEQDKNGINKKINMLKEVIIKEKKANPLEHSQNLNGAGNADQVITAEWLEQSGYLTLFDALRAKATSIVFTPNRKLRSNRSMEGLDATHPPDYMLVIVDGIPQFNRDEPQMTFISRGILDDYSPEDIESVEILLGVHAAAIYGTIAAGGAVVITTKRGRAVNNYYKESPGVITFKANGFYKARQFYMPKYEHTETDAAKKDLRTTIYWNPEIPTDKSGNAQFDFYNADGKGSYKVVVEGIDAEGNLGRQVYRYKVE